MKKLCIILLFASCWDGEVNGRKYRLDTPCIKSHTILIPEVRRIGNTNHVITTPKRICDVYGKTDTIWQKK